MTTNGTQNADPASQPIPDSASPEVRKPGSQPAPASARRPVPGPDTPPWLRHVLAVSYVFLFLWLATGLLYGYLVAIDGEVLRVVIASGVTLAGAGAVLAMVTLVRIGALLVRNTATLDRLHERIVSLEARLGDRPEEVNLSAMGPGDPEALVAASVETDSYPRLVAADGDTITHELKAAPSNARDADSSAEPSPTADRPSTSSAADRLETEWMAAFERRDLAACRRILERADAALPSVGGVEGLSPERLAAMRAWLNGTLRDRKRQLRETFGNLVRQARFAEALAKGTEIAELFPGSAIAAEFERIRPHLEARVDKPSRDREGAAEQNRDRKGAAQNSTATVREWPRK